MTTADLAVLSANVGNTLRILCRDGESLVVKVILVSEEEGDVIYDLVSSSVPSRYQTIDPHPAYRLSFGEIESVSLD